MDNAETIMRLAQAAYNEDLLFRRYVDCAVVEAMSHAKHIPEGEIEHRDLHHVAVVAAMAVLRLAIDGNHMLKAMEVERDAAKKVAQDSMLRFTGMSSRLAPINE